MELDVNKLLNATRSIFEFLSVRNENTTRNNSETDNGEANVSSICLLLSLQRAFFSKFSNFN